MAKVNTYDDPQATARAWIIVAIIGVLFLFVGLPLFFGSFYTVNSGEKAVLLTFGKATPVVQDEGLHFKIPFVQQVVKYDTKTRIYGAKASAASQDLQTVSTSIALNYRLVGDKVPTIYLELGTAYDVTIIQPIVQDSVKAITAKFSAEELIKNREEVKNQILESLKQRLASRYIIVEDISITNFDFSTSFNDAIEAKVTAEQEALQAQNVLQRTKIEAEQKVVRAQADADSKKIVANADAYALMVVQEQLKQSEKLVQYKAIEKWDGKLPQYTGGFIPFINVNQVSE